MLRIRNVTRNTVLAVAADVADTSKKRRTGLLKRTSLPAGEGLWIAPCEGIHSFRMKFAIDALFLDRRRKVLKIRHEMGRGRISLCLRAHSVLELPAGTAKATGTVEGDQLEFERATASTCGAL
jgi:uncharacterized membrane protein (UPF0127 family)